MITSGITRDVFCLGKFIIKTPTIRYGWKFFLKGMLANIGERDIWSYNYRRDLLCPVLLSSFTGLFIVMPKCELLEDTFDLDLLEHCVIFPGDIKHDNFGVLKGQVVKLDYGD